jgi:hypothetical protein
MSDSSIRHAHGLIWLAIVGLGLAACVAGHVALFGGLRGNITEYQPWIYYALLVDGRLIHTRDAVEYNDRSVQRSDSGASAYVGMRVSVSLSVGKLVPTPFGSRTLQLPIQHEWFDVAMGSDAALRLRTDRSLYDEFWGGGPGSAGYGLLLLPSAKEAIWADLQSWQGPRAPFMDFGAKHAGTSFNARQMLMRSGLACVVVLMAMQVLALNRVRARLSRRIRNTRARQMGREMICERCKYPQAEDAIGCSECGSDQRIGVWRMIWEAERAVHGFAPRF